MAPQWKKQVALEAARYHNCSHIDNLTRSRKSSVVGARIVASKVGGSIWPVRLSFWAVTGLKFT
jgi:hypothetical protein